jgi:ABC-type nickel/cobalt efflux system permease component RcnA
LAEIAAHERVAETAERHERLGGPRWMPIAAAVVAVVAALANLASGLRANQALIAKNQAILSFTRASDTYNYYQAKSIKEDVYLAASSITKADPASLRKVADHEHTSKQALLTRAQSFEKQADEEDARSEHLMQSHETMETGVAFLQVAIVILSISSLVGTLVLPLMAAAATAVGLGFSLAGFVF